MTIWGMLPNSCHQARIKDIYPGGNIAYIKDLGSAQVFIEETVKPNSELCLMYLVPWISHVSIPDDEHDEVTIFVNDVFMHKEPLKEEGSQSDQYRVIALVRIDYSDPKSDGLRSKNMAGFGPYAGCSIIPSDSEYPAIYYSAYGPDSKADCEDWVSKNCCKKF